ncbi:hypothetical protein FOXYS1_6529 [Fusarium oxysporum]|uniref:Uncharacterized protein n=1 Tax=Fusarium oxysporum TaxID=5507 RepID=A0A8H5EJB4_FUSOX|nr:hypothetical protein FOXYS1_6529 [Fusarium oxysporum]
MTYCAQSLSLSESSIRLFYITITIDFVLDEIDPNVSGIWMEGLISLWFEKGLSFDQFDTLYRVGVLTEALDTHFIQSLMPSDDEFLQQMPSIINSLEFWEEIPAWHEVCLLKRLFQSSTDQHVFARSFEPLLKRNLIIITQILPADAARRPKHDPPVHDDGKLIRLDQEPLCDPLLDFVEEHVASSVEFGHEETTPGGQCIYPSEWLDVINSWVMRLNQKGNISASSLNYTKE